jgi:DNA-directed RNA polymerase subunit RPC12/RpoP
MNIDEMTLQINLEQVRRGVRSRMPGIRKCADCGEPFIANGSPVKWCPECRVNHHMECRDCGESFRLHKDGLVICESCQRQFSLF